MAYAAASSSLTERMIRAARLEVSLYEEVEADLHATNQAVTVVAIVALAGGIGSAIGAAATGRAYALIGSLVGGIVVSLVMWAVWSYVTYFVGTRFFKGQATYGEVLRTLGFAYAPGVLNVLSFIPVLGGLIALVAAIWTLVAGFIGLRQALDLDNGNTVATIVVGVIAIAVVLLILTPILAIIGLGAGLLGAA